MRKLLWVALCGTLAGLIAFAVVERLPASNREAIVLLAALLGTILGAILGGVEDIVAAIKSQDRDGDKKDSK